jgi:hypothetical protein
MNSNWENFLKNQGEWLGTFTQVSLTGELLDSVPSLLSITPSEDNLSAQFRLRRYATGSYDDPPSSDIQQDYQSLGRQVIFFDTGAFSKGSLQLAPYSQFGAEYGFVAPDRRLRFVQLYDDQNNLSSLILIREFRKDSHATEQPLLTPEQLVGTWEGTACTAYADLRSPDTFTTRLEVELRDSERLQQRLSFGDRTIETNGRISGHSIHFEEGAMSRTILLLPDGTSSNAPAQLKRQQPFFLELGWLISPTERQRLIRSYNDRGEWVSATHVIERKQS